jgi:hypothetical protein
MEVADRHRWLLPFALVVLGFGSLFAWFGTVPDGLPMPTFAFGMVTPTCGLTRGTAALLGGRFGTAWRFNPASFLVVGAAVAIVLRAAVGILARRWPTVSVAIGPWGWALVGALVVALWVNQQAHADFVMNGRL